MNGMVRLILRFLIRRRFSDGRSCLHIRPNAIQDIVAALRLASSEHENSLHFSRTLLILLHTIKVLAAGRLVRTRSNLQAEAPKILDTLGRIYVAKVTVWRKFLENGGDDEGGALESIEQSLLSLRILRRLIVAGYDFPNRHTEVQDFWSTIVTQLGQMLNIVLQETWEFDLGVKRLIERHVIQMAKMHLDMAKSHPAGFALLRDSSGLAQDYWRAIKQFGETFGSQSAISITKTSNHGDADEEDISVLENISLKGLLLLRACVRMIFNPAQTFKYQHAEDKIERKRSTELIKDYLLTDVFAREMMETLVTRFFVFRARDLREWEEEPEEWERREEGEGDVWEFSIRSCSEKLFLDLIINYKGLLVPPLLNVFYSVASTSGNPPFVHSPTDYRSY